MQKHNLTSNKRVLVECYTNPSVWTRCFRVCQGRAGELSAVLCERTRNDCLPRTRDGPVGELLLQVFATVLVAPSRRPLFVVTLFQPPLAPFSVSDDIT